MSMGKGQYNNNLIIDLNDFIYYPELDCFCYGIDNGLWNNRFGIQFYDYDSDLEAIHKDILNKILEIFPDDCNLYKTDNGYHFISFALERYKRTLDNVDLLAKEFPEQNYHVRYNLTLRISPKFKIKTLETVSHEPKFLCQLKKPSNDNFYAYYPLLYYFNYLGLPIKIFNQYRVGKYKLYKPKYHIYRTKKNTKEV